MQLNMISQIALKVIKGHENDFNSSSEYKSHDIS